ncbi:MAG: metal ABC transporter substrate-binding protein [Eubacterium sp.]
MKLFKRFWIFLLVFVLCMGLAGCHNLKEASNKKYRLNIVTSLFPYYDMVRAIVGNEDTIHVSMTVAPGQDSHSFEPAPADVINIQEADVFIYNGGSLETWVDTLLDSLNNDSQSRFRMMDYVDLLEEEHMEGMDTRSEAFHEDGNTGGDEEHGHEADEHIWTSPVNMQIMTRKICDELCKVSPEDSGIFQKNAENYIQQLKELDSELHQITEKAEKKEIIFADKFPILYFAKEYGLKYYAAFPGCGSDMEPSAKTIAFLIDKIKEDRIKAVFYLELSSHTVANTISEDTGAKTLQFNSCHNITQKQFDNGVTYVDLMKENVNNLRKALN